MKYLFFQYLKLIRAQKFYGYLHFKKCTADYPEKNTSVQLAIGNKTANFRYMNVSVTRLSVFNIILSIVEK